MEVITFSVISAILVQVLCCVSYLWYVHYIASSFSPPSLPAPIQPAIQGNGKKNKNSNKKGKQKNTKAKRDEKEHDNFVSDQDISASSTEKQLAEIIMSEQRSEYIINTTAVNERPSVKAATKEKLRMKMQDPEWESVLNKKHKKKIPVTNLDKGIFQFKLDEDGGIVETPLFEIHFPSESVLMEMDIEITIEEIEKFSDDTMEKIFVTPVFHFKAWGIDKFEKQFVIKLNTPKTFGRGWSNGLFAQIEINTAKSDEWSTIGRTEYHFGKPVKITHNSPSSFRAVVTRQQGHQVTRHLNFAAYTNRPTEQDPAFYTLYIFIFDRSPQTSKRVEEETKRFLLKIPPKECDFTFGSNLELEVVPTKMFSPSKSEILMKWSELSGANVHARFQVKLKKKPQSGDGIEFKTMVSFKIWKILPNLDTCQEEYFQFYWTSVGGGGNPRRNRKKAIQGTGSDVEGKQQEKTNEKVVAVPDNQTRNPRKTSPASNRPVRQEKNISQGRAKEAKQIPNGGLKNAPYKASVKPGTVEGTKQLSETTKKRMKTPTNTPTEGTANGPNRSPRVRYNSQGNKPTKQTHDGNRQQGRPPHDGGTQQGRLPRDGGRQQGRPPHDDGRQQGRPPRDSGRPEGKPAPDDSMQGRRPPRGGGRQQGKPTPDAGRQEGRPPRDGGGPEGRPAPNDSRQGRHQPRDDGRQQGRPPRDDGRQEGRPPRDGGRQQGRPPRDGGRQQGRPPRDGGRQEGRPPRNGGRQQGEPALDNGRQEVGPARDGKQQDKPSYDGGIQQENPASQGSSRQRERRSVQKERPNPTHGGDRVQTSKENVKPTVPKSSNMSGSAPKETAGGAREQGTVPKLPNAADRAGDCKLGDKSRDDNQKPKLSQNGQPAQRNDKSTQRDSQPIKAKMEGHVGGQYDEANQQENKAPGENPDPPPMKARNRNRFRPRIRKESDNKGPSGQSSTDVN